MSDWPGLDYVMTHGLPGYPAPRVADPKALAATTEEQVEKRRAYWKRWAAKHRPTKRQTLDAGEL